MNDNKNEKMDMDSKQPNRGAKIRAQETINRWVDHVHSVGGGDSTADWHSSSTGIHGDTSEDDDSLISEEVTDETDQNSSSDIEGNSDGEQELLLKVWGPFLRRGTAYDAGKPKRPRIDNRSHSSGEDLSADLGTTSEDDDNTSERSEGSIGSLADFIC